MKFAVSIFALAAVLLSAPLSGGAHAIHMTYATAAISDTAVVIEVSYYDDDLQKAVSDWERREIASLSEATRNAMISRYVAAYFRYWDGKKQVPLTVRNMTLDGSSRRFSLSATRTSAGQIILDHRALFKLYSDQLNLITVKQAGKETNHIMSPSNPAIYINS